MCGVIGIFDQNPVNQLIYDGLLVLQHRGQDAAGITTCDGSRFYMHKGNGLVQDVFHARHMRNLQGHIGIGHVRYPTAGTASAMEAQPFYVNSPFGIALGHNGNITNTAELKEVLVKQNLRHLNTNSDSEILLNIFAYELERNAHPFDSEMIFSAIQKVYQRAKGAYAVVAMIANYGLVAFRDPFGIRPLVIGSKKSEKGTSYVVASESVALDILGFTLLRDVAPGEAIFIDMKGELFSQVCATKRQLSPCIFEYVYLARPDSIIDGVSVYQSRLNMGINLAKKIQKEWGNMDIDVVVPVPDTSRPCALQLANYLNLTYREGFIKNRYIGRTFIMPEQTTRKKSVRHKLNPVAQEFKDKNVLLVDDSIVRGTTSKQIVQMARDAGAKKVFLTSAAPPVLFPNVYGIDMPSIHEFVATSRTLEEICHEIGADALIYQDLSDLKSAIQILNPLIENFDSSCFDAHYVTGDITKEYLHQVSARYQQPKSVDVAEQNEMFHFSFMNANKGENDE